MTSPMSVPDNPLAVLTLIAAPAVFTNASSVLVLGTGNRLARVVDRTRYIAQQLRNEHDRALCQMYSTQLERLEKRGQKLVGGMTARRPRNMWAWSPPAVQARRSLAPARLRPRLARKPSGRARLQLW